MSYGIVDIMLITNIIDKFMLDNMIILQARFSTDWLQS